MKVAPGFAAEADLFARVALHVGTEGLAEVHDIVVEQFHVGDAADVVFAKNGWFEHCFRSSI